MKRIFLFLIVFPLSAAAAFSAGPSVRAERSAVSASLVMGKNTEDSTAQIAVNYEYGIIKHLSVGGGYVYVDGRHPIQAHGAALYVKGYAFDSVLDIYGKVSAQLYYQDGFGLVTTYLAGAEWQSPFKLCLSIEGGAELEGSDWGYMYGFSLGLRF